MLRDYQSLGIDDLRSVYSSGARSALYVLPTGGGKTTVFTEIARLAVERGKRVCVLAHRRELVDQASKRLDSFEIPHGIIAAGMNRSEIPHGITVASVQTLVRRTVDPFDLIIIDEAHHAPAGSWAKVIAANPGAKVLGVTATPCRLDGKGLAASFEHLVMGPNYSALIAEGFLTDADVYAPHVPDMSAAKARGGDYAAEDVADVMERPKVTGDVVDHYLRLGAGKRAVAFCAGVRHAEAVAAAFIAAGVPAACVHGGLDADVRADRIADLEAGRILVLTAADLISEGFDLPAIEVAIMLRPTKSLSLYLQQVGRALRPAPGKIRALVLDHAGNVHRHGFPTQDREWTLDGGAVARVPADPSGDAEIQIRQCPQCYRIHRPSRTCPACGYVYVAKDKIPKYVEGDLIAIQRRDKAALKAVVAARSISAERFRKEGWRAESMAELLRCAERHGRSQGEAWQYAKWMASKNHRIRGYSGPS